MLTNNNVILVITSVGIGKEKEQEENRENREDKDSLTP